MLPGKPIDFSERYEDLAYRWASHFDTEFGTKPHEVNMCIGLIEAFIPGVYSETIEDILSDPQMFAQRVSEYRSGLKDQTHEL